MTYDDRIRIETPEGVDLELTLAGLGSRMGSAILDALVRGVLYIVLTILAGAGSTSSPDVAGLIGAFLLALIFLIEVGYDIAFETLGSGRTIGKRAAGLRVLRSDGSPVDFRSSAVRNLLRLIDGPGTAYIAGTISILMTSRNQRVGDLAAGTIVVRDRLGQSQATDVNYIYARENESVTLDATALTMEELATLRRFLERRTQLAPAARMRLAIELADRLRWKVAGVPEFTNPEHLIEEVVRAKSSRG